MEIIHGFSQFHFLRPWWLLALLPILILIYQLYNYSSQKSTWAEVCDPHLLSVLLKQNNTADGRLGLWLVTLGWLIAIIALAGPTWSYEKIPLYRQQRATVFLIDMSNDMLAQDIAPMRLLRARYKLMDFLQKRKEGQTGLIAYAGEPYVVSPLTEDSNTIVAFVPELTPDIMPVPGNNIEAALSKGAELIQQSSLNKGNLVFITATHQVSETAIKLAKQLHTTGLNISVLAIGHPGTVPLPAGNGRFLQNDQGDILTTQLDITGLKKLAQAGGGRYASFQNTDKDIDNILSILSDADKTSQSSQSLEIWQDKGYWLSLALLPLALLAFRRGWLDFLES